MVEKELRAAFGIDEFSEWVASELNHIEDQLSEAAVTSPRYIELKSRYQALKDARKAYMDLHYKKLKNNSEDRSEPTDQVMPESATYQLKFNI